MTHAELEFFEGLAGYISDRYKEDPPSSGVLEAMIMGFLAGSEFRRMNIGILSTLLAGYAGRPAGEQERSPYAELYRQALELQRRTDEVEKPLRMGAY